MNIFDPLTNAKAALQFYKERYMTDQCIVLLSGGQDSTTCLMLAIEEHGEENVHPIVFFYNQKHQVEVEQAQRICEALSVEQPAVLPIEALDILGGGALTNSNIPVQASAIDTGNVYAEQHGLPPTVIPGRNMMFLTLAIAYGAKIDCYELWTGGCLADYEGYPDCRPEFYRAAENALSYALDENSVTIVTPLTHKSKADTFAIAHEFGKLDIITELTHTCYNGVHDEEHKHAWGYGCGECPACQTREAGWNEFVTSAVGLTDV